MTKKKLAIGCGGAIGLLIVVAILSSIIGSQPSSEESTPEVELLEAKSQNLIDISTQGTGSLMWIELDITSKSANAMKIAILPATVFEPQSSSVQSMVVRRKKIVTLEPEETVESIRVSAACANMRRNVPKESDNLTAEISRAPADLVQLLNLSDFHDEPFRIQQFAIWTITDNPERSGYVGMGYYGVGTGPSEEELEQVRLLLKKAEISTEKYQALR